MRGIRVQVGWGQMDWELINHQEIAWTNTGTSVVPGKGSPRVSIPGHRLLRCIGSGSYGEVWLARDPVGIYRAVKIVYRKAFKHQRPFEREWSGIRNFQRVAHEGFIGVLADDFNQEEGYFYYVMDLADDRHSGQAVDPENYSPRTLAREILVRGRLPVRECLQLGLTLSRALAELHKHGLVHRDLKPSNIIFVGGEPKLADIGLVTGVEEARSYVGTEGFIPPEGPGTPQADLYGLGKVLYEAGTGKDRHEFPELPTFLDRLPDQDTYLELNEVILRACKTQPGQRYQSAEEMHGDLLLVAEGKSVRRRNRRARLVANCKRMVGIVIAIVAAASTVAYQLCHEWKTARETLQRQVSAGIIRGNRAMEDGDLPGSLPGFVDALQLDAPDTETTHRLRLGSVLAQCSKLTRLWFVGGRIDDGTFSPDGNHVLIAEHFGKARICDVRTGRVLPRSFGGDGGLLSAAYSPDGRFAVTASYHRSASMWTMPDLEEVWRMPHPARVLNARFSPDGARIVTCGGDGFARVWNVSTREVEFRLEHGAAVTYADFSHDGRLIATAGEDCTARIWDAADGRPVSPPLEHGDWVTFAAFSPDDRRLVTASTDHRARVWEVPLGRSIPPDLNHRGAVNSAIFSPDGRFILTASFDGTVRLWHANNQQLLASNPILRQSDRVLRAAFDAEGRRILAACADGTMRIWDLSGGVLPSAAPRCSCSHDGSRLLSFNDNLTEVRVIACGIPARPKLAASSAIVEAELNRNGRFVTGISTTDRRPGRTNWLVQVWRADSGEGVGPGIVFSNRLTGVSLNDDGRRLVAFGDRNAQVWNVRDGRPLGPSRIHERYVTAACFSPNGETVATCSGGQVEVWDPATGRARFDPLQHPAPVVYAAFSPDGSRLLACCSAGAINKSFAQLWDAVTGRPMGARLNHDGGVNFGAFGPSGRRVVTASEDFTARIWDVATARQLGPALTHEHRVNTARFSPDGKWIVTASADRTARVWSAETGNALTPPLRHLSRLAGARFLTDGRRILTSDAHGHSWIWNLPVEDKPAEDLRRFARLLSGEAAPANPRFGPKRQSLQSLWKELREKYPSSFNVSPQEIAAWHEFQARASEAERDWSAAAFHLERLVSLRPDDSSFPARLNRVRHLLSKQSSSDGAP